MVYVMSIVFFLIDQVFKILARTQIKPSNTHYIFPQLYVTYTLNPGGSLSMLSNDRIILICASFLLVGGVIYVIQKYDAGIFSKALLSMILGGTLSNLFDRILFRSVVDYIFCPFLHVYFNLADVMVILGLITLCTYLLLKKIIV